MEHFRKAFRNHSLRPATLCGIIFLLLCAGATVQAQNSAVSFKTIVIDAGHGGKDPGCVSKDGKTFEKNLVLDIAQKFGSLIERDFPSVKVIYTRKTDVFLSLGERSSIANKAGADLFVSIHVNAQDKGTAANGYSSHIFGRSQTNSDLFSMNMDMVKRENSVILLEDDYSTTYQDFDPNDTESYIFFNLMQNAFYEQSISFADGFVRQMSNNAVFPHSRGISQDPYFVLWKTSMPSVLVECGFISNPGDLAILRTEKGREGISEALFKAFCEFKESYEGSTKIAPDSKPVPEATKEATKEGDTQLSSSAKTLFGCQVLVSAREMKPDDPSFKGWTAEKISGGRYFKYIVALGEDLSEVRKILPQVKKDFPDAFLVKISDGKIEIAK